MCARGRRLLIAGGSGRLVCIGQACGLCAIVCFLVFVPRESLHSRELLELEVQLELELDLLELEPANPALSQGQARARAKARARARVRARKPQPRAGGRCFRITVR